MRDASDFDNTGFIAAYPAFGCIIRTASASGIQRTNLIVFSYSENPQPKAGLVGQSLTEFRSWLERMFDWKYHRYPFFRRNRTAGPYLDRAPDPPRRRSVAEQGSGATLHIGVNFEGKPGGPACRSLNLICSFEAHGRVRLLSLVRTLPALSRSTDP